jgi:hypothetical protein
MCETKAKAGKSAPADVQDPLYRFALLVLGLFVCALLAGIALPTNEQGLSYNVQAASQYFGALLLGAGVGAGELMGRFPVASWSSLSTRGALNYMLLNAAAAGAVLWFVLFDPFGWESIIPDAPAAQVLFAGLGAIALLPLAQFKVQFGGSEVAFGPARAVTTVLDAAVTQTSQDSAAARAAFLLKIDNLDPDRFVKRVAPACLSLLETLSSDRRDELINELTELASKEDSFGVAITVPIRLSEVVGWRVIQRMNEVITKLDADRAELLRKQIEALMAQPQTPPDTLKLGDDKKTDPQ